MCVPASLEGSNMSYSDFYNKVPFFVVLLATCYGFYLLPVFRRMHPFVRITLSLIAGAWTVYVCVIFITLIVLAFVL